MKISMLIRTLQISEHGQEMWDNDREVHVDIPTRYSIRFSIGDQTLVLNYHDLKEIVRIADPERGEPI